MGTGHLDRPKASTPVDELPAWGLSDVVTYCTGVRGATAGAATMEEAASQMVRYLRRAFRTTHGRSAFVLGRFFNTAPWEDLPADLRDTLAPAGREPEGTRAVVLLASDGEKAPWCDRRLSPGLPPALLESVDAAALHPLVAALARELGLDVETFVHGPRPHKLSGRRDLGVFHIPDATDEARIPHQSFVREQGIRSVVGFGGLQPSGNIFALALYARVTLDAEAAVMLPIIAASVKVALLPFVTEPMFIGGRLRKTDPLTAAEANIAVLEQVMAVHESTVAEQARRLEHTVQLLHRQEERLRKDAAIINTLHRVGVVLGADLDIGRVVQEAVDAVVDVTGAEFGAFFHNQVSPTGEAYTLYALSGAPREAFERFPMPRNTDIFAPTFVGSAIVRSADITADPRYGRNEPYAGMPPGHLPVRSYLAVPVISETGVVHGGIFLGHHDIGVFEDRAELLAVGIAAQAAAALDNATLYSGQRRVARALQANLLTPPPSPSAFQLAVRYVPAFEHAEVGGDWYDSFVLPDGDTAVIVGDVVGHDLTAAACMAQLRNVVRAVAVDRGGAPADIVRHADEVSAQLRITNFATLILGRVELGPDGTLLLRWTNAGHPPPLLLRPDGRAELLRHPPNLPLGILPGETRRDHVDPLSAGSTLLLYTDGLVEGRHTAVSEGLDRLCRVAETHADAPLEDFCDRVVADMAGTWSTDDIALIALRVPAG
jgi:serine phosphatase RsbU (regulator of sigma subunit)